MSDSGSAEDYDYVKDGQRSHILALEAIRGHAYVRVPDGSREAVMVCHKHGIHGHEEFEVPMTRNMLLVLMQHVSAALTRLG
jgi:hypothetical protein